MPVEAKMKGRAGAGEHRPEKEIPGQARDEERGLLVRDGHSPSWLEPVFPDAGGGGRFPSGLGPVFPDAAG